MRKSILLAVCLLLSLSARTQQPFATAQWICGETVDDVPWLGRDFHCKKSMQRATLLVSALGVFTMKLNGQPVSENRLEPGESQWDQTVLEDFFRNCS